jgi:hypothetical protein
LSSHGRPGSSRRLIAHSSLCSASSGSFATTIRAIGYMPCARIVSSTARMRLALIGELVSAPISRARGTPER